MCQYRSVSIQAEKLVIVYAGPKRALATEIGEVLA